MSNLAYKLCAELSGSRCEAPEPNEEGNQSAKPFAALTKSLPPNATASAAMPISVFGADDYAGIGLNPDYWYVAWDEYALQNGDQRPPYPLVALLEYLRCLGANCSAEQNRGMLSQDFPTRYFWQIDQEQAEKMAPLEPPEKYLPLATKDSDKKDDKNDNEESKDESNENDKELSKDKNKKQEPKMNPYWRSYIEARIRFRVGTLYAYAKLVYQTLSLQKQQAFNACTTGNADQIAEGFKNTFPVVGDDLAATALWDSIRENAAHFVTSRSFKAWFANESWSRITDELPISFQGPDKSVNKLKNITRDASALSKLPTSAPAWIVSILHANLDDRSGPRLPDPAYGVPAKGNGSTSGTASEGETTTGYRFLKDRKDKEDAVSDRRRLERLAGSVAEVPNVALNGELGDWMCFSHFLPGEKVPDGAVEPNWTQAGLAALCVFLDGLVAGRYDTAN